MRIPLAQYGWKEISSFSSIMLAGCLLSLHFFPYTFPLFLFGLIFVIYFFRDPYRAIPEGDEKLVSPADGTVVEITDIFEDNYIKNNAIKISIFMSVTSVHVNRIPYAGKVEYIKHKNGQFMDARIPKCSEFNEYNLLGLVINRNKTKMMVKQIAGQIARRIVCDCTIGQRFKKGDRFGMIKFGSRLEVFLPKDIGFNTSVTIGQKVKAGETVLGTFTD
ncbi:MAG: phosphatidylserine decarboxylase family protein [Candidatus Anammoxibacter sp.]